MRTISDSVVKPRHTIEEKTLWGVHRRQLAGHFGRGNNKEIVAEFTIDNNTSNVKYLVIDHGKTVGEFYHLNLAVDKYNEI